MHYLNFFLSCSIRNFRSFIFFESFFYNKIDILSFLQVLIPTVVFSIKAITENQLHDFQQTFLQEILFTQFHIVRNNNHRRSSNKIWAQEGILFSHKVVIFPSFSLVIMNFFSPIGLISLRTERLKNWVNWYEVKLNEIREAPVDSRLGKLRRLY